MPFFSPVAIYFIMEPLVLKIEWRFIYRLNVPPIVAVVNENTTQCYSYLSHTPYKQLSKVKITKAIKTSKG